VTDGERWAREALADLASARWRPAAVGRFLIASQRRANQRRRERPELARQARRWLLAGACAYAPARPPGAVPWWTAVALMLDWHLGMVESEDGEPRPLGPADACTLLRAWLVPVVAQRHRPALVALGLGTDVLDGALARASVPTRAGRDLEGLVDGAFAVAALRASLLPRPIARLEALRIAAGVGLTTASYLRGAPVRARRDRAAAVLRAGGLLSGRPRLGGALVLAGALRPTLAYSRTSGAAAAPRA
jgi:hypothetical protein